MLKIFWSTLVSRLILSSSSHFGSRDEIHAADSSSWPAKLRHRVISNSRRWFIDRICSDVLLHLFSTRWKSSSSETETASTEILSRAERCDRSSFSRSLMHSINRWFSSVRGPTSQMVKFLMFFLFLVGLVLSKKLSCSDGRYVFMYTIMYKRGYQKCFLMAFVWDL